MACTPRIGRFSFRAMAIGHSSCGNGVPSGEYKRQVTHPPTREGHSSIVVEGDPPIGIRGVDGGRERLEPPPESLFSLVQARFGLIALGRTGGCAEQVIPGAQGSAVLHDKPLEVRTKLRALRRAFHHQGLPPKGPTAVVGVFRFGGTSTRGSTGNGSPATSEQCYLGRIAFGLLEPALLPHDPLNTG